MEKEFMDFKARGMFFAEVRKNGKVIETIEKHNLIVNTSCHVIARLLAGAVAQGGDEIFSKQISKIGIGAFATDPAGGYSQFVSSVDKTTLDGDTPLFYKNFIKVSGGSVSPNTDGGGTSNIIYNESNSPNDVTYQFYIGTSECNVVGGSNNIWEFGLFTQDDIMFSMLTRLDLGKDYPIVKDETVDISGYWKIQVRNTSV